MASNLLMFGILLMGLFGLRNIKSTFFPEVESRIINIQIVYPGSSPEEIEEGVITKIEENLKGLTGIEQVTSVSSENSGSIVVEVQRGYKTDVVLQDVKNAVDRINSFPVGMEPPVIFKLENIGFAISFALSGEVSLQTLKQFGRQVEDELLNMDEISKVTLSGFPEEEIEISFRENDLRSYGLTFAQATQAVRNANLEITGGTVKGKEEELLVRARNKAYYADGLRDIVVKTNAGGGLVYLHQVADVKDQWADTPDRSYLDGKPAVVVTVQNTLEEDMLTITEKVRGFVEDFNQKNDQVKATVIRDGSVLLQQRIDLLSSNGIIGFFLVLIFLAMFLNWRIAFWVALSIPVSFAGMFLFAYLFGLSINVISLFGMIIVIGILVDDGIVISESIYQLHEKGVPRLEAAITGTLQVLPAVFTAVLTTMIAFSAFFFIDGRLGDFFSQMAAVVILSLAFSLVEGVLILPTHVAHSKAMDSHQKNNVITRSLDKFMIFLRDRFYGPLLDFVMHNRWLTATSMVAFLFVTIGAIQGGLIKTTFFPVIERDDIIVDLQMPAGTREQQTQDVLDQIEVAAWKVNEKLSQEFFNGEQPAILRIEKSVGPNAFKGQLSIALLDGESRDSLSLRRVVNDIRRETGPLNEAELVTYGSQSAFGKPISVSLVSKDYQQLNEATEAVKQELSQLAELADVVDNNQEGLREINVTLKEKARYLGLNLQEVVAQVRQGFFGSEVQRLQRGVDEVRVWVRYDRSDRDDITKLQDMRIRFNDGREYPLSEIADLSISRGVIAINHIEGKREIKIEADVANDDVSVSDITSAIKADIIPAALSKFPAVQALYEGQNREQEKSQKSMQLILPVVALLMFFSIALTFRSISQTLIVFATIPFGFIGVAWGHYWMGAPISMFSFLGIIALIGVMVNDSLVMVTTYNQLLEEGNSQMEALHEAGLSRFRPILLTSVTTIAGLAPIMLEKSLQAQFLIPMAISVSFGLLASTVVVLVMLPALLIISNRIKVYSVYLWEGIKPSYEIVEPAVEERKNYFALWAVAGILSIAVFVAIVAVALKISGMAMG